MNADTATAFITSNKGADIEIVLTDGDSVYGTALSVNSKGVNVKDDGKTRSVALSRVAELVLVEDDTFGSDDDADDEASRIEELANEVSDGATTAEVAALLSDYLNRDLTPKELRVRLRALGLGVGKGRKYALSAGEFRAVIKVIETTPVATA